MNAPMFYLRTNTGKLIADDWTFCDHLRDAKIYRDRMFAYECAVTILKDHPDLLDIAVTDLRTYQVIALARQQKVSA